MEENFSMEDFAAMLDQSFHKVYNGDIVEGKIIEKDEKGLMVDVASYMDGVLPVEELLYDGESYDDYQVGDTVRAMVKYVDSREGQIHLSKKEADKLGIWDDLKKLQEDEQPIDVKVKRAVNGGLRVVYKTVEGFLPASQISIEYVEDTSAYVGQTLTVQITEVNEEKKNLIVSRKVLEKKEAENARQSLYTTLRRGETLTGKVVRLTNFGAFVEIAPHVDGLIHVSDMSWRRVKNPAEMVSIGDVVKVTVLDVDPARGRIGLSLKDVNADPWKNVTLAAGQVLNGTVTNVIDSGAFVEVAPGLEGFVHVSNISDKRVSAASDVLKAGMEVKVKVLQIDEAQRRISLSMKAAAQALQEDAEKAEYKQYRAEVEEASTHLGDLFTQLEKNS